MSTEQKRAGCSNEDHQFDAALIRRVAGGDEQALVALYDRTHQLVYSVARRLLRKPDDAEEVTVDVFLQIWRRAGSFDPSRGNAFAWIVMMTQSRAIDRLRSLTNRAPSESLSEAMVRSDDTAASDPERCGFLAELRQHIHAALGALSAEQRIVIEGAYFKGLSHREMARQLNLPLGTVKQRLRLGVHKLRGHLSTPRFCGAFEQMFE